ncbi:hypothetical protein Bca4012_042294 [Brassica carinata]
MAFFTFCFQTRPWSFWKVIGEDLYGESPEQSVRVVWFGFFTPFLEAEWRTHHSSLLTSKPPSMNVKRDGECMGVDMLLLDSKIGQGGTVECSLHESLKHGGFAAIAKTPILAIASYLIVECTATVCESGEGQITSYLGCQKGGPENIQITAFAIALKQVAIPENKACIQQMKKTQVLALALLRRKCRLVTGVVVGSHSFGLNWDTGGDNPRLYRPHKEFVKSLCEIRNRVEAFALQYEMHASSYQRDIATAQQVSKTSGTPAVSFSPPLS